MNGRILRVLVADDHQWIREDFVTLLSAERDIRVVAEASDGREAVELAVQHRPDVVLMDIRMPKLDGLTALREINLRVTPKPPAVLVVTTFELDEYVFGALRESAAGFLLKDHAADDLPGAVRTVARGDAMVSPSVTRRMIRTFARPSSESIIDELTDRERQVLQVLASGGTNEEIAAELFISLATVKSHVRSIFAKIGVVTRTQAVIVAYETGVVRVGSDTH